MPMVVRPIPDGATRDFEAQSLVRREIPNHACNGWDKALHTLLVASNPLDQPYGTFRASSQCRQGGAN